MMAAVAALDATADEGMTTKEFTARMKGVTPIARLTLRAHTIEHDHRRARVRATIEHDGFVTAEFEGVYVAALRPRHL